jgi:hypothetical protein
MASKDTQTAAPGVSVEAMTAALMKNINHFVMACQQDPMAVCGTAAKMMEGEVEQALRTALLASAAGSGRSIPVAEVAAGNFGSRLMWHTSDAQELTPVGTLLYAAPPPPVGELQGVTDALGLFTEADLACHRLVSQEMQFSPEADETYVAVWVGFREGVKAASRPAAPQAAVDAMSQGEKK